ncbi:hypothetical protein GCM10027203_12870 [Nonomuraea fastidiosa]
MQGGGLPASYEDAPAQEGRGRRTWSAHGQVPRLPGTWYWGLRDLNARMPGGRKPPRPSYSRHRKAPGDGTVGDPSRLRAIGIRAGGAPHHRTPLRVLMAGAAAPIAECRR